MKNLLTTALLLLAVGLSQPPAASEDKKEEKKEIQYTGVLIGTGGSIGGASSWIDMYVQNFTSNEEVLELLTILKEKGQDELQKELYKRDVGRIVTFAPLARRLGTLSGKWSRMASTSRFRKAVVSVAKVAFKVPPPLTT